MTQPKERIDLAKLALAASHLSEIQLSLEKTIADCKALQMDSVLIEGWPTLARGVQYVLDQSQKFVGSASKIHELKGTDLLMDGQSFAPTKKPYKSRAARLEEVMQDSKTKPKRNNNSK
tara:strand:+ start:190 stop:546 length:357 start_codon:yes stop_codon:yes gene_type:complete